MPKGYYERRPKTEGTVNTLTDTEETVNIPTVEEPDETFEPPKEPERQNIDTPSVKVLTLNEIYRKVVADRNKPPKAQYANIKLFRDAHPGFTFPHGSELQTLFYIRNVSHFKLYEDTLK